jgi:hypothetical protein
MGLQDTTMLQQSVTYAPQNGYPFHITAKRYWSRRPTFDVDDPKALTLILLHATGFHKETWEPSLERIFDLALQGDGTLKIREAWAIECPNHGVSAQLNESVLQQPPFRHNCMNFARIFIASVLFTMLGSYL